MIRILYVFLGFLLAGSTAIAQELRVRSGEHGTYTRLVVQIPVGSNWTLTPRHKGARLDVAVDGVTFDMEGVFARLFGNRLISATQSEPGASLELEFGCECVASAYVFRGSMIVIDIAPGRFLPSVSSKPFPVLPLPPRVQRQVEVDFPGNALSLPLQLPRTNLEEQLMSRLLQGSDRDLIDLNLANVGDRPLASSGTNPDSDAWLNNLQVSSVLDDLHGIGPLSLKPIETEPPCIADADLNLENWKGEPPFQKQLAASRAGLYREFDKLDSSIAKNLVHLYIYYGFGAEALQVIGLTSQTGPEADRLIAIAELVDGDPVSDPNPFRGQQKCDGDVALWAALTEGYLEHGTNPNAIEQAFAKLPAHLRRNLGPALADILVRGDQLEAARRVLRAVDRIAPKGSTDMTLAQAQIAAAQGDTAEAEALLAKATTSAPADQAPLALARLVEKRWWDRGGMAQHELDLAAAFALELRRSEDGPMMAQTYVLALGLHQSFDEAMRRMGDAPADVGWNKTRNRVMQLMSERADDITFLRYALSMSTPTRDSLQSETAVVISKRLANLGFGAPAVALTERLQNQSVDRAMVRAQAALANGRPDQARLEIEGHETEDADRLRARAYAMAKDYERAASLSLRLGDRDAAAHYFWLAGQPDISHEPHAGKFGVLADFSRALEQPIPREPQKPLSDAAALLEDSAFARDQIISMLSHLEAAPLD